ncbi:MAG: Aromatic/aminoadipate aminotransferase 1 [Trizodia sp. TS-e1964]|nr:MAG: Aromatic/aminoadipate aminotransferase 1 [Trizodia sp. TS-e1964]
MADLPNNPPSHILGSWKVDSWKSKPVVQNIEYEDKNREAIALKKLERLPPLVTPVEIVKLKQCLRDVALGKAFLLQGGDCAELFDYCEQNTIDSKIKLMLQMSLVLIWGMNKPVVRIARIAGQFAKPRSKQYETVNGVHILSFRGDNVNGFALEDRKPDPDRLVSAYFHSTATLNHIRAQLSSGFADLHSPLNWNLGHVHDSNLQARYASIVASISSSLRFMSTVGASPSSLETVDLYTSHEGLLLDYEQSLTRYLRRPASDEAPPHLRSQGDHAWYNTSAHFLWIGDRTRQLSHAHVEYFRGIDNPIGLKCGPTLSPPELIALLDILDPHFEPGKVTLITRFGFSHVTKLLPPLIRAVKATRHIVVWQCDPMHGNGITTAGGIKTRRFEDILGEVSHSLRVHHEEGSYLGGVHLELTGEAVTECVGGSEGLDEGDLGVNYTSYCDPRLNEKQALDLAFTVAGFYRGGGSV